jgi:hypothetical protein
MMRQELWRESEKIRLYSLVNCWALCEQYLLSCLPSWGRPNRALPYRPGGGACLVVLARLWTSRAVQMGKGFQPLWPTAGLDKKPACWVGELQIMGRSAEYQKVLNGEIIRQRDGVACRTVTPAQADAYRHVALHPAGQKRTGPTSGTLPSYGHR